VYYCGTKLLNEAVQIRDPDSIRQEGFQLVKEYEGGERILLSFRIIELGNDSAWQLEEQGLVIFLPFLFDGVIRNLETKNESTRQETLKSFVIHDIVGALGRSYQRGNLTSFDVQKLKQICRQMAWKILGRENWMQSMENQELILDALEADVDFLERASRIHPLDSERK
jgi:hypothetical protein